jgi:hypothetical protein
MLQMLGVFAEFEHAHHRRPHLRPHRAPREGGTMVRRATALRLHVLQRGARARPRPSESTGRPPRLRPLRAQASRHTHHRAATPRRRRASTIRRVGARPRRSCRASGTFRRRSGC